MTKPGQLTAMISSTAVDLPEHRKQVVEACLREGIFPIGMEQLPARDATGIQVSLDVVDEADIYIGVYAWRYGWVPDGQEISITEMEFNRAVERKQRGELRDILIFVMHKDHPVTIEMVEADKEAQERLSKFKERASSGRIRKGFKSADDLRGLVIQALGECKRRIEAAAGGRPAPSFHRSSDIPVAPARYVAHPYTLLQTAEVIGRREELKLLTDWITKNEAVPKTARIFCVVAIGGMGKSALTWKWFEDIAPNELPNLAGRMWWSFYESDASFDSFVIRALAYAASMPEAEVRQIPRPDREDQLLRLLDERPFLLVLDGLERILLAYARLDAARMPEDDLDEKTANVVDLPEEAKETYLEKHRLRQCTDLNAGRFLRQLVRMRASRVLISTRLYPAELQTEAAQPRPGCHPLFLRGLTDDDALALWRGFIGGERSGTSERLLPLFRAFGNYPLLLRALAGEVAQYRPAPGDFARWRKDNPDFNPAQLPLKTAKTHVLEFALRGLGEAQRHVLCTLAAFRMPATWDTLRALLTGDGKPCCDDRAMDAVLTELEDRGLLGWDRRANRYDLHPIVRSVVWAALDSKAKRDILGELRVYFDAIPKPPHWERVESLEDLTPALELFDKLVSLERYEDAYLVSRDHLEIAMHHRLGAGRLLVELLERFFPDGVDAPPRLREARSQSHTLNELAMAYYSGGEPGRAAPLHRRKLEMDEREKDSENLEIGLENLACALWPSGCLREAEGTARYALRICREQHAWVGEGVSLQFVGTTLAARGEAVQSEIAQRRALAIWVKGGEQQSKGVVSALLAQRYVWVGEPGEALPLAEQAWELAHIQRLERDFIRAARLHGEAALGVGDLSIAEERLQHALNRGRAVNDVQEELPALTALAELHRQRREYDGARELLEHVWIPAERGPYPLWHADARNVLAQIERDLGNRDAAVAAATQAYRLAWCDGPPYAYHYGLTNARRHLQELGAPEPQLPPFDESKFPPMPDVELNPKDEFWVDPATLEGGRSNAEGPYG